MASFLHSASSRECFEEELERVRRSYDFAVSGYVVMPEHVHLLLSRPHREALTVALQVLKQKTSRRLRPKTGEPFWQRRYYDFNIWTVDKHREKLEYIHRNPVQRGLVSRPEDWAWSGYPHYVTGAPGTVEIERFGVALEEKLDGWDE